MSGPFGSQQWMYASGGFYDHPIDQSLRFNDDDSAYLNWTPSSTGNRKTWTWSAWVKRGNIARHVLNYCAASGADQFVFQFTADNRISIIDYRSSTAVTNKESSALFRDPSAWYHVVLQVDTTDATAEDRFKVYVNGDRITSWSTNTVGTAQNTDIIYNFSGGFHQIGRSLYDGFYLDGYMAEVHFVDGTALDASSFGENKSGVWIPKRYSGSYGTNGFYLDFGNSGSLGADSSGNGNNWTPNNLAATDQVIDSPTNNFATLNQINRNSTLTLAEGNLSLTSTAAQGAGCGVTMATSSGKWYYETVYVSGVSSYIHVGVIDSDATVAQLNTTNTAVNGTIYRGDGNIYENSGSGWSVTQTVTAASTGDIIGVAYDLDAQTCTYYLNNTQLGSSVSISYMNPEVMPYPLFGYYTAVMVLNFGQDSSFAGNKTAQGNTDANGIGDFYYSPPSGYLALCAANLPDPVAVIDPAQEANPQDHFNTVLYTGNGTTNSITGVGFQPDFTWIKRRNATENHYLMDVVRGDAVVSGAITPLSSSGTAAEAVFDASWVNNYGKLSSFDADGFTVSGNGVSPYYPYNGSGQTYVGWNWKAGGTGVSNTDGTITSTVSANADAGFSIVSYTGTGSAASVGHGLSSAPEFYIIKRRTTADDWLAYYTIYDGSNDYLVLNLTNAGANGVSSAPTSSVFNLNGVPWSAENASGDDYIAYCFHSVDGFSKIGLYTGNGSTDGPFVYCGFRPAFVIAKPSSTTGNWIMWDNTRDSYNAGERTLFPNLSNAEESGNVNESWDLLSNGFKLKSNGRANSSGVTYLFMAFAEMPFKYANAR